MTFKFKILNTNSWPQIKKKKKKKKKRKPVIGARFKTFQMVYYMTYNNLIECMCKSKN